MRGGRRRGSRSCPGVSSAVAAPAFAGIPVTHRGVAQSFAVVTGSTAHGDEVDLARVATATDTLVVLMAAGKLAADLRASSSRPGGRRRSRPRSCSGRRRPSSARVVGTLASLPGLARAARIGPPATLVVGEVAALARELAWIHGDDRVRRSPASGDQAPDLTVAPGPPPRDRPAAPNHPAG